MHARYPFAYSYRSRTDPGKASLLLPLSRTAARFLTFYYLLALSMKTLLMSVPPASTSRKRLRQLDDDFWLIFATIRVYCPYAGSQVELGALYLPARPCAHVLLGLDCMMSCRGPSRARGAPRFAAGVMARMLSRVPGRCSF